MDTHKDIIHITCGLDQNYAPHLATMLYSLQAANPKEKFVAHVLIDGMNLETRLKVEKSTSITINWIEVSSHPVLQFDAILHISRATYLRLLIAELLDPTLQRVLYLDVDMIVCGSVRELWDTNLDGKTCAAVVDPGAEVDAFIEKWNLSNNPSYFNAGVILFDMNKLRSGPAMTDAIQVLQNPDKKCEYADQDALNIVLWNDWLPIDPKWNFQRKFLYHKYAHWHLHAPQNQRPAIIHFTEVDKPWRRTEWHPCRWLYLKAALNVAFTTEIFQKGNITLYYLIKSWLTWMLKRPPMFK